MAHTHNELVESRSFEGENISHIVRTFVIR